MIDEAAVALDLGLEFVEKDFWVTEVLRVVARGRPDARFIFKGGTSLSKGYGLIKRMSEDVDILVIAADAAASNKVRSAILQDLTNDVSAHIGIPASTDGRKEEGRKLASRFVYTDERTDVVSEGVLLELSYRGHPEPAEPREILSYVAEYARAAPGSVPRYEEFEPFTMDLLAPVRTLLEKVYALHATASAFSDGFEFRKIARCYYDVKQLLDADSVRTDLAKFQDIKGYCEKDLMKSGVGPPFSGPARPPDGFASSPAFDMPPEIAAAARDAYQDSLRLVYPGAPKPTLDDCTAAVRRHRDLL